MFKKSCESCICVRMLPGAFFCSAISRKLGIHFSCSYCDRTLTRLLAHEFGIEYENDPIYYVSKNRRQMGSLQSTLPNKSSKVMSRVMSRVNDWPLLCRK